MTRIRIARAVAVVDLLVCFPAALAHPNPDLGTLVLFLLGVGAYVGIGALLVSRVPTNPIGFLMLATGTVTVTTVALGTYAAVGALQDPPWPEFERAGTIANAMFIYPVMIALVGIPLVFPDGRLPSRRFRWVVVVTIAGMVAWLLNSVFEASLEVVDLVAMPVAFGGAITAIVLRFRRGGPVQRRQVKWLAAVVVVGAIAVLAGLLVNDSSPDLGNALVISGIFALFLLPFVIGIAILRYRLYEIDRIISRTLAYTALTGALALVYVAAFIALQAALAPFTQGGGPLAVAASTLAVFALFQPLRRRLQAAMDRRFNRSRYEAQRTVEAFAARLRDEVDIGRVGGEIQTVIGQTLAPASVGVWLRRSGRAVER
jgi:hypothetical protein